MPRYEYRCRACGDTFELTRPMSESSAPCTCPQGHDDTVKLLSTVAVSRGGLAAAGSQAVRWRWLLRRRLRLRIARWGPTPGSHSERTRLTVILAH